MKRLGNGGIRQRLRRGFTLIEVTIAVGLLGVVGAGIATFLSAFATGSEARTRVSDPALEATLALRRMQALAPGLRTVLAADATQAVLWVSDRIPGRTVHLSELGCVRIDPERRELIFESIDDAAMHADRSLETEFAASDDFLIAFDSARKAGIVGTRLLAEGLESAAFSAAANRNSVVLVLGSAGATSSVLLTPVQAEEPLR